MQFLNKWLSVIHRHGQIFFKDQFEECGLHSGQPIFVVSVCENPGISQDELAELLRMNKSTVARTVFQLEQSGFLRKEINSADKRIANLYPTKEAKGLYPEILRKFEEWNCLLIDGFTKDEEMEFYSMLKRCAHNAIKYAKNGRKEKCQTE